MRDLNKKNILNVELCKFLSDKGFSYDEIVRVVFSSSFFPYDYTKVCLMVTNSYNYLLTSGFSLENIKKMALREPGILTTSNDKKKKIDECFFRLGVNEQELRKIISSCPVMYSYSEKRILSIVKFLNDFGYSEDQTMYIIKRAPNIFNFSISSLNTFVEDLKKAKFSVQQIKKIGRNYPLFWSKSIGKIDEIINALIDIGLEEEDTKRILVGASSVVGYDVDTIKTKFNDLVSLGFSEEQVIKMIKVLPTLITSDIERTRNIVDFFISVGLRDKLIEAPKSFFMQGVESSYAIYYFYRDIHVEINQDTYNRLFYGWKYLKRTYGVTKEDLFSKYDYKKMIEDSKNRD